MKTVLKFAPWILCLALFLIGRLTAPSSDVEDLAREREREALYQMLEIKQAKLEASDKRIQAITQKMYSDSLKNIVALKAKDQEILRHKRNYENINLSRATASELDSVRAAILALHPAQ